MLLAPAIYAEDDPNDGYFMQHAFQKAGVTIPLVILTDGQAVLDYLAGAGKYADRQTHPFPSVLLLDLKLPRVSGFEILEWIRQQQFKSLKIIVVSSSGQALDIDLAKKLGALEYIIKPGSPAKLTTIVERLRLTWLDLRLNHSSFKNHANPRDAVGLSSSEP